MKGRFGDTENDDERMILKRQTVNIEDDDGMSSLSSDSVDDEFMDRIQHSMFNEFVFAQIVPEKK